MHPHFVRVAEDSRAVAEHSAVVVADSTVAAADSAVAAAAREEVEVSLEAVMAAGIIRGVITVAAGAFPEGVMAAAGVSQAGA